MEINYTSALDILNRATILHRETEIMSCIDKIAQQIEQEIAGEIPVFLTVMNGGMFFAAELLKRINKPINTDYIHASRYSDTINGASHVTWYRQPKIDDIKGKTIYIIDDILDEGHTLAEIKRFLTQMGAKECRLLVLIDKDIGKSKPVTADYVGLTAPNKFLFGCGMDIYGVYRYLPDIYIHNN